MPPSTYVDYAVTDEGRGTGCVKLARQFALRGRPKEKMLSADQPLLRPTIWISKKVYNSRTDID